MKILKDIKNLFSPSLREHYSLREGDFDAELNKKVEVLIVNDDNFIIYLDDLYDIQWRCNDAFVEADHCGEILSNVAILQAKSNFIENKKILRFIRFQIAEALARCFSGQSIESSREILKEVDSQIAARNYEVAWRWYFCSALEWTAWILLVVLLCWIFKSELSLIIGEKIIEIIWVAGAGVLGALSSVRLRANRIVMDANAGKDIHELEGFSRVLAGLIASIFAAVIYKSEIFSSVLKSNNNELLFLIVIGFFAGLSERFIPSLVSAIDEKNSSS